MRNYPPTPSLSPLPPPAQGSSDLGAGVWEYLAIVRRRWLLILLVVVVSLGVAAFVTLRTTKVYRATATVRIEAQAPRVLGESVENVVEMGAGGFWSNIEYYETQYKIITSRDVALRVVKQHQLNEDPAFLGVPPEARAAFKPDTFDAAAEVLQSMLQVEPIKDSRLALIHIDDTDPKRAQMLANAVAAAYVDKNLETMLKSTVDAVDWLSSQLDDARTKLSKSEEALLAYKQEHDILSIALEDKQNLIAAQMTEAAQRLMETRAKRIELQARKAAVSQAAKVADPLAVPIEALNDNLLVQQLKQKYAELSQERGELSSRYGDKFPKLVELNAKMEQIRVDIGREVHNIIASVDAELETARNTEAGLTAALEEFKAQAQDLAVKEIPYNSLAREATNNAKVYEMLLGRSGEADLSRLLRVNNVDVLDAALLPEAPITPRVSLNLALALVIGLLLGVGLAVVLEFTDRTIKTQDDVDALGVPFLGIVPSIDTSTTHDGYYEKDGLRRVKRRKAAPVEGDAKIDYDRYVHTHPKSQVAESLRSIRTNLMFMSTDRNLKRLLVTSPSPQEGKTTVAANLAIVMAQSGTRVLLVDTDMRRPRVHKAFGIERPRTGLSTMVLGESDAASTIRQTGVPNLDVLVCGPTPPNPSELIHTDAFQRVVDEVAALYDRVIFDSPPIGVVTDAAILSKLVDGTVLIIKSLRTTRDAAKHAVGVLRDIDSPILGVVLNDLNLADKKYGQHYYYYYKKYGYYYGEGKDRPSTEDGDPAAR
ncbi:MAG: polysaccharide biosynthesis tyrosine autokinase [Proteobacteria bacterium]|jgi:capsular exopolysaccharide synthesis family protein|nr:polysaccharide biosynthesis tyrosine autokinase [Pseudomonadota bacterium]